jgi:hypothetical protein
LEKKSKTKDSLLAEKEIEMVKNEEATLSSHDAACKTSELMAALEGQLSETLEHLAKAQESHSSVCCELLCCCFVLR